MIRSSKPLLRIAAAMLCVVLVTFGLQVMRGGVAPAPDYPCTSDGAETVVEIPSGTTGSELAKILFDQGVVKSSSAYFRVAVADKRSEKVAPGGHRLTSQNCAREVLAQLLDSQRITGLITVVEGAWNSEIFDQMVKVGFTLQEIQSAKKRLVLPTGFKSLEGLLFPALYSFDKETSAKTALESMIKRATQAFADSGVMNGSGKFSPSDLLIIASIIQAEGDRKDFTKISQVIRNRLEKGMPLQMDSTVHYIKSVRGSVFLSTVSTLLKSPYNTYRNYGLPPGPIGNPGIDALKAAVEPVAGDWLFFITVAPGDTRFTASIDEFNSWKLLYKSNLRKGLFRSSK